MEHGDVTPVIFEIPEMPARDSFQRLARRGLGDIWNLYGGMPPESEVKDAVRKAAKEASKKLVERGRVILRPTRILLEMPEDKKKELIEYANDKGNGWFSHSNKAHVTRRFGRIFKIRYVPAEGYEY